MSDFLCDVKVEKGVLPLSAQSAYSAVPTHRDTPAKYTYFNNPRKVTNQRTYDRIFHYDNSYNQNLHRCDREHTKSRGLNVNSEEMKKDVPALMSTAYGGKLHMFTDHPERTYRRIIKTKEFHTNSGIPLSFEAGYGGRPFLPCD